MCELRAFAEPRRCSVILLVGRETDTSGKNAEILSKSTLLYFERLLLGRAKESRAKIPLSEQL